jgi:hypothetical protein
MTFIEEVYTELSKRTPIGTDEFSTEWLGQCRSYYTSIKARDIEASSRSLIHLLNKLTSLQHSLSEGKHDLLKAVARDHGVLCKKIAEELAKRSYIQNIADMRSKHLVLSAVEGLLERKQIHDVMPVLIL